MKKTIFVVCIIVIVCMLFTSCSSKKESDNKSIVCTMFPQYDWVTEILGEKSEEWDIELLINTGVDLHSYEPTAKDIITIDQADLVIYVGGESDAWADKMLSKNSSDKKIVNMLESIQDEIVEDIHDCHGKVLADEHVWLSLSNAEDICEDIMEAICSIDKKNSLIYKDNYEKYIERIEALDEKYDKMVENAKYNKLLFADRFPFVYLADDYDLEYQAAFSGCSTETNADSKTIEMLISKLDEWQLDTVVVLERSDKGIANTVINGSKNKDREIVVLNSLQSINFEDIKNGADYLELMEENYTALFEALN